MCPSLNPWSRNLSANSTGQLLKGTLYSVDQGSWTQIGIHIHRLYVCLLNRLTGIHADSLGGMVWTMEWTVEFLCPVDGTFVLAAFIPFHSVRPQKILEDN